MGSQEVFALWVLVEPPKGGFGYDATDIALLSSIAGAMMPPMQMVFFPPFCRKHGVKKTFMMVSAAQGLACCLLPLTAPFDSGTDPDGWLAFIILMVGYSFVQIANSMTMSMIGMLAANSARTTQRGTVMGLSQMLSSVGRTAGPAGGALLIAWSLEGSFTTAEPWAPRMFPLDYHLTWFCAGLLTALAVWLGLLMPGSIDRKMDESPEPTPQPPQENDGVHKPLSVSNSAEDGEELVSLREENAALKKRLETFLAAKQIEQIEDEAVEEVTKCTAAAAAEAEAEAALRAELFCLKPSALRRRAVDTGALDADMDVILDADDPKRALIDYIVNGRRSAAGAAKFLKGGPAAGDDANEAEV